MENPENKQFLWIVTGEKYVPWALASSATFRLLHPEYGLIWLASDSAAKKAEELAPDWLKNALEIRISAKNGETDKEASRRLKVRARQLVEGDFFQIDADILLARRLKAEDFTSVAVVAAALNRDSGGEFREDFRNNFARELFKRVEWEWPKNYFNTGFIFWRDNPSAYEISSQWETARDKFAEKTGMVIDQPAFNHAASQTGNVCILNTRYNASVSVLPQLSRSAACYHYYASEKTGETVRGSALVYLADKFERKSEDVREAVESFVSNPKPFVGWGANEKQYLLAGQWQNYLERKLRVGWDHFKKKLKC